MPNGAESSVITPKEAWDGAHCLLCGAPIPPPRSKSVVKMWCRAAHRSRWHQLRKVHLLRTVQDALATATAALDELAGR